MGKTTDFWPIVYQILSALLPLVPMILGGSVLWLAARYNGTVKDARMRGVMAMLVKWAEQQFSGPGMGPVKEGKVLAAFHDRYPKVPQEQAKQILEASVLDLNALLAQWEAATGTPLGAQKRPTRGDSPDSGPGTPTPPPAPSGGPSGTTTMRLTLPPGVTIQDVLSQETTTVDPTQQGAVVQGEATLHPSFRMRQLAATGQLDEATHAV